MCVCVSVCNLDLALSSSAVCQTHLSFVTPTVEQTDDPKRNGLTIREQVRKLQQVKATHNNNNSSDKILPLSAYVRLFFKCIQERKRIAHALFIFE